jgi:hypothetical protein
MTRRASMTPAPDARAKPLAASIRERAERAAGRARVAAATLGATAAAAIEAVTVVNQRAVAAAAGRLQPVEARRRPEAAVLTEAWVEKAGRRREAAEPRAPSPRRRPFATESPRFKGSSAPTALRRART